METFELLCIGWVAGVITVFAWALTSVYFERRKVANATISPKGKLGVVRNTPSEYN